MRRAAVEPDETLERARVLIERDPARPGPGQEPARRVGHHRFVGGLCPFAKVRAVDDREIDAARDQYIVPAHQIGRDHRRVHHAPGEQMGVELGRRQRPRPRAHQHERAHPREVRQGKAETGRPAPVVAHEGDAGEIEAAQQRGESGDVAVETVGILARWLLRQPEADHVRDDDAMPRPGEWADEIAIEEAPGRIAVQQHDRIARAFIDVMHAPTVDAGEARPIRPLRADGVRQDKGRLGHRVVRPSPSSSSWPPPGLSRPSTSPLCSK